MACHTGMQRFLQLHRPSLPKGYCFNVKGQSWRAVFGRIEQMRELSLCNPRGGSYHRDSGRTQQAFRKRLDRRLVLGNDHAVQRPIPLWLGGGRPGVEAVIERIGRLADGWFPQFAPDDEGRATLERMRGYARAAGRDPATIGVEGRISIASSTPDTWAQQAEDWGALGSTHLSVNTMRAGLQTPDAHIAAIEKFFTSVRS